MSRPGDRTEIEAERLADRALGPSPGQRPVRPSAAPSVRPSTGVEAVDRGLRSESSPLEPRVRSFMEPRFGRDLGHVRVHVGPAADAAARAVEASALTVGRHVVFARGQYAPSTEPGRRLIAHELAHVVQSDGPGGAAVHRQPAAAPAQAREGRALNPVERTSVKADLELAIQMADAARTALGGSRHRHLLPGADPRTQGEAAPAIEAFRRHFKSSDAGDLLDAADAYTRIASALRRLTLASFRVVPRQVEEGDPYAYVYAREPFIYLVEPHYFAENTVVPPTGKVTLGVPQLPTRHKAATLLHEAAHFTLGIRHSGGVFGVATVNCEEGFPVRSFIQASNNAYVYANFAECISRPVAGP